MPKWKIAAFEVIVPWPAVYSQAHWWARLTPERCVKCFHLIIMNSRNSKFCLRNRSELGAQKGTHDEAIWLVIEKIYLCYHWSHSTMYQKWVMTNTLAFIYDEVSISDEFLNFILYFTYSEIYFIGVCICEFWQMQSHVTLTKINHKDREMSSCLQKFLCAFNL